MAQTAEFPETWTRISGFPTVDPSIASYMLILSAFARNSEHALMPSYCGSFPDCISAPQFSLTQFI